jgi:hypothetical protein
MIGISRFNVAYAEWNHDDDYFWRVRWATLRPPTAVLNPGIIEGPVFSAD